MKEELQAFENRSDDWLAKERAYENSVSAWDFDEGKKVRLEHHNDCDAKEVKANHERRHKEYNETHDKGLINDSKQFEDLDKASIRRVLIPIFAILALIIVINIASLAGALDIEEAGAFVPFIIFAIGISLITKKKKEK